MKRTLFLALVAVAVFSAQASADFYYYLSETKAAEMTFLATSPGDSLSLTYIGTNPGGTTEYISGNKPSHVYGDTMTQLVGFSGNLSDDNKDLEAIQTIGLGSLDYLGTSLDLVPDETYIDGFQLLIANDNNQGWSYRTYVWEIGNSTRHETEWTTLSNDTQTTLILSTGNIDFHEVCGIGFEVRWTYPLGGSISDDFHTSVVPVPAAVILGVLGLGVVGIKLRKYA